MDYMNKLFKQHPFIYKISGKYYAFGNRVCAECTLNMPTLDLRFDRYCDACVENVTQGEARDIFAKVKSAAELVRDRVGACEKPEIEIEKFGFTDSEIKELEHQIDRYIDFWRNYKLNDFSWT